LAGSKGDLPCLEGIKKKSKSGKNVPLMRKLDQFVPCRANWKGRKKRRRHQGDARRGAGTASSSKEEKGGRRSRMKKEALKNGTSCWQTLERTRAGREKGYPAEQKTTTKNREGQKSDPEATSSKEVILEDVISIGTMQNSEEKVKWK